MKSGSEAEGRVEDEDGQLKATSRQNQMPSCGIFKRSRVRNLEMRVSLGAAAGPPQMPGGRSTPKQRSEATRVI